MTLKTYNFEDNTQMTKVTQSSKKFTRVKLMSIWFKHISMWAERSNNGVAFWILLSWCFNCALVITRTTCVWTFCRAHQQRYCFIPCTLRWLHFLLVEWKLSHNTKRTQIKARCWCLAKKASRFWNRNIQFALCFIL